MELMNSFFFLHDNFFTIQRHMNPFKNLHDVINYNSYELFN